MTLLLPPFGQSITHFLVIVKPRQCRDLVLTYLSERGRGVFYTCLSLNELGSVQNQYRGTCAGLRLQPRPGISSLPLDGRPLAVSQIKAKTLYPSAGQCNQYCHADDGSSVKKKTLSQIFKLKLQERAISCLPNKGNSLKAHKTYLKMTTEKRERRRTCHLEFSSQKFYRENLYVVYVAETGGFNQK